MTYLSLFVFPFIAALAGLFSLGSLLRFVGDINQDLRRGAKPHDRS